LNLAQSSGAAGLSSMNVTQALDNLEAVVEFTGTMLTAVSNLQGSFTGGMMLGNMTLTQ
jgi:hypothetical protein